MDNKYRNFMVFFCCSLSSCLIIFAAGHVASRPTYPLLINKTVDLEINKSKRQLVIFRGDTEVATYKIALGNKPTGAKEKEGDMKTPEGTYHIRVKNPKSHFYLSLQIDYPNESDAADGLDSGRITKSLYKAIVEEIKNGKLPPQKTPLGGEIFIHGGGTARDWTWGCIALDNKDVKQLYEGIDLGTRVDIVP